jgi:glutathione S-transferase
VTLSDSSVILEYLDDRYPAPALRPESRADRARARWLEEYADTRMGDVFIWQLFNERMIRPFVWGEKTDEAVVARTLADDVPPILDYLESLAPMGGFFFGDLSIADIAVGAFFRNAAFVQFQIDAARWPRIAALVARTHETTPFQRLAPIEEAMLRTPPARHREALEALGVRLTRETCGTTTPRKGVMSV